jgi:hypothetical protein
MCFVVKLSTLLTSVEIEKTPTVVKLIALQCNSSYADAFCPMQNRTPLDGDLILAWFYFIKSR